VKSFRKLSRFLDEYILNEKKDIYCSTKIHFICPSTWVKDQVIQHLGEHAPPLTVIPNPLDTEFWKPLKQVCASRSNIKDSKNFKILTGAVGGSSDPRKGFSLLVQAMMLLPLTIRERLEVTVFGGDKCHVEMRSGVKFNHIGKVQSDLILRQLYCGSDIMAVPSLYETWGQTAAEALSCGIPVLAFDNTGVSDIVTHLESGFLANYGSASSLGEGLKFLMSSDLDEMSLECRKSAINNFSYPKVAEKMKGVYQQCLQQL
jgi:glycosyltransferase involved in cell wall biosynthesis